MKVSGLGAGSFERLRPVALDSCVEPHLNYRLWLWRGGGKVAVSNQSRTIWAHAGGGGFDN